MGRQLSALSSSSAMYANWKADQLNEKMEQERVRLLYHQFMAKYPTLMDRPTFANVQPVGRITSPGELEFFTHNQPNSRPHVHFPKRMHWCAKDIHAIVYHPTHEYLPLSNQWVTPPSIMSLAGQTFDLFVTRKNFVCYAGIYTLHSLRQVHLPGSPIPTDVCPAAIQHAAGIAKAMSLKIVECFPGGQIKTECFGLQCLGFDKVLYEVLRRRFQVLETPNTKSDANTMKRRADGIDLRQGAQKPRLL
ncbi:hypothetical protein C8R43DRAFT_596693 [Mycena crocata]|nr:hypothetical protein C8R43DRAFT_596693 [Mycena crocata]